MSAQLELFKDRLLDRGCKQIGGGWTCPSHDDKSPSLSISDGDKGVLFTCHAGCSREDILSSLSLQMSDLYFQQTERKTVESRYKHVADYIYVDEVGIELSKTTKLWDNQLQQKTFRQYHKEDGEWVKGLGSVRRVLYRLNEVVASDLVVIGEGEKDAETIRSLGFTGTTSGGAKSWRDEYAAFLDDKDVVIAVDTDEIGMSAGEQVKQSLLKRGKCKSVCIFIPTLGKDITEHIEAGGEFDARRISKENAQQESPLTKELVPISQIDHVPSPSYLIEGLVEEGEICVLYGKPGGGKSFCALDFALCVQAGVSFHDRAVKQGDVLYIAAEALSSLKMRKLAWEEHRGKTKITQGWFFPRAINLLDPEESAHFKSLVRKLAPKLIVIDTLSRSIPGANENASEGMTTLMHTLQECCNLDFRPSVLLVHHVTKSTGEARGHSSLEGAASIMLSCAMENGVITLKTTKNKNDLCTEQDYFLKGVSVKGWEERSAVLVASSRKDDSGEENSDFDALECIMSNDNTHGISVKSIMDKSGKSKSTINRQINSLLTKGMIVNISTEREPRYCTKMQANKLQPV